jgi:hypothetical protein
MGNSKSRVLRPVEKQYSREEEVTTLTQLCDSLLYLGIRIHMYVLL